MTTRRCCRVFAVAAVILVCLGGSAAAVIVPGEGMAGIRLRMTEAQVQARLGSPLRITRWRGALGFLVTRLHYGRVDVDLQRLGGTRVVVRMLTTKPGEHTASGVGVGSRLRAVEQLRGAHCWSEVGSRYCAIGNRNTPLDHVTMFRIGADERVTLISVSLVVNS